jgi:putative transposase
VKNAVEGVRARLFDLSAFMKEFKYKFSVWFNKRHGRRGTLWEERFKSLLVEGKGGADGPDGLGGLLAVAAYIDLNPVRAGIVDDPKDYRWCSYGEAVAGGNAARKGLTQCVGERRGAKWRKVARAYRLVIFGVGEERAGGSTVEGAQRRRCGFTQAQIDKVISTGGRLPMADVLRCRVRYFTDGVALGSGEFLAGILGSGRDPTELSGADFGGLAVASRLRKAAICPPG